MLTCSGAKKRHQETGDYPGGSYHGPWPEPEHYLEDTGGGYYLYGTCDRCEREVETFGYAIDRWLGVQICMKCVKEIKHRLNP